MGRLLPPRPPHPPLGLFSHPAEAPLLSGLLSGLFVPPGARAAVVTTPGTPCPTHSICVAFPITDTGISLGQATLYPLPSWFYHEEHGNPCSLCV